MNEKTKPVETDDDNVDMDEESKSTLDDADIDDEADDEPDSELEDAED